MRRRLGTAARVLFGVAGVGFLVVAFARSADQVEGALLPPWWLLAASAALVLAGLGCAYLAWSTLLGGLRSRPLATGFYLSQLGKYIPGAVWQAVGQVGYTTRAGVRLGQASTAFGVFAVTQVVGTAAVGALLALAPGVPGTVRAAAAAAAGTVVLLDRRWMVRALRTLRRWRPGPDPEPLVPAQAAILRAAAWSVGTIVASGAAFALLLAGLQQSPPALAAVPGYALAWTVGFLAVPVPSGLGVREAVLIAGLGGHAVTAELVAASVYLRLATMAAEVAMVAGARWLPWPRPAERAPSR